MIWPQLGPEYIGEHDPEVKAMLEASYADAITLNQSFWTEADLDHRYYSGDQNLWNDLYGNLPANQRKQFNFNRIRRVVSMIEGHQRRNRMSMVVVPVENGDEVTADQFTKIIMWNNQRDGVLETISDAFLSALIGGLSFLQVWVDYRNDPISGDIKVSKRDYNEFIVDPYFKKRDMSDCRYVWTRSFLSRKEIISLLPDKAEEIAGLPLTSGSAHRDGKFQFAPENYNWNIKNLMTYDEYYYRDYRAQKLLIDTQTGETLEWKGTNEEDLKTFLSLYPQITVVEQTIPTVRLAILVQGKVMYHGPNPLGIDNYPLVPIFAYYHPELPYFPWRIQGVVRGLRSAQYLYNRRLILNLDLLESQLNSGFIYKENALVNPADIFMTGQGKGLALKKEANITDVQRIDPPQVPPSMLQLAESLGREIQEISGVNEELLGSAIDSKAGILSMLRQGAGLTTLQGLFDQLDSSQKILGKLMIDIIQNNFVPAKVRRIIQEEPTQQFYNKTFGKYDVMIEPGLNTTTQRQMEFAQLLQLRDSGVPIPDEALIQSATIQNKQKIMEMIAQSREQQQQLQQAQAQVAMEEQQARTELAQARALADRGSGIERISRVAENQALAEERKSASQKDDEERILNFIKALKEIETIDLANIEKYISLVSLLKGQESVTTVPAAPIEPSIPAQDVVSGMNNLAAPPGGL